MTDATLIAADAALDSLVHNDSEKAREEAEALRGRTTAVDRPASRTISNQTHTSRTDPDASLAQKRGSPRQLKYKINQTIDAESRVILDTKVTTGARHDRYVSSAEQCRDCPQASTCSAKTQGRSSQRFILRNLDQDLFEEVHAQMRDPTFGEKMSERMWKCEGLFAEAKQYHNLSRAKYRGRPKVQIQAYLTGIAQNLKRLVALFYYWIVARFFQPEKQANNTKAGASPHGLFQQARSIDDGIRKPAQSQEFSNRISYLNRLQLTALGDAAKKSLTSRQLPRRRPRKFELMAASFHSIRLPAWSKVRRILSCPCTLQRPVVSPATKS